MLKTKENEKISIPKKVKLFRIPSIPLTSTFFNNGFAVAGSSSNPFMNINETDKGAIYLFYDEENKQEYELILTNKKVEKIAFTDSLFFKAGNSLYGLIGHNPIKLEENVVDIARDNEGKLYVLKQDELIIYTGREVLAKIPLKLNSTPKNIHVDEFIAILSNAGVEILNKKHIFSYSYKPPKLIHEKCKMIAVNDDKIAFVEDSKITIRKINTERVNPLKAEEAVISIKDVKVITPYSNGFLTGTSGGEVHYIKESGKSPFTTLDESISSISIGYSKNNVAICITGEKGAVKLITF